MRFGFARLALGAPLPRRPPREELVNVIEFEDVAKQLLPADVYSTIAGSDRRPFDRITFRPRMLVPTTDLDLSVELFGQKHFAPIVAGPIAEQRRYHAEGELATIRGASAAHAAVIISNRSSVSIGELATTATTPLWYAVYADAEGNTQKQVQEAVAAGCKVVCITVGATREARSSRSRIDWKQIEQIRRGADVPIVIKGLLSTADVKQAIDRGIQGIVVSDHGGSVAGTASPIETLSSIADVAAGRAVLLVDGSFRRGTDILKALVLGAQAVLVARPVMWGLAAYGAEGVQAVIELLQTSLGRNMCNIGAPNLAALTRAMVKIHRPRGAS